ncbi:hypothetical protein Syun_029691 [Stephania yunnanensis]|uniref:Uncharacterized protein n=1 Tax=Stephania yunnanensis TaxID=152371 RepID=A0AAP0HJR7_9MAGN
MNRGSKERERGEDEIALRKKESSRPRKEKEISRWSGELWLSLLLLKSFFVVCEVRSCSFGRGVREDGSMVLKEMRSSPSQRRSGSNSSEPNQRTNEKKKMENRGDGRSRKEVRFVIDGKWIENRESK